MKNLKKILLATLVLVTVISAAVITVVASTEPTRAEKLAEIKATLDAFEVVETTDSVEIAANSQAIKKIYETFAAEKFKDNVEGYSEFVTAYDAKTIKVANQYLAVKDFKGVTAHMKSAPPYDVLKSQAYFAYQNNYNKMNAEKLGDFVAEAALETDAAKKSLILQEFYAHYNTYALIEIADENKVSDYDTQVTAPFAKACEDYNKATILCAKDIVSASETLDAVKEHNEKAPAFNTDVAEYKEYLVAYADKNFEIASAMISDATANQGNAYELIAAFYALCDAKMPEFSEPEISEYTVSLEEVIALLEACQSKTVKEEKLEAFANLVNAILYVDPETEGYSVLEEELPGEIETVLNFLFAKADEFNSSEFDVKLLAGAVADLTYARSYMNEKLSYPVFWENYNTHLVNTFATVVEKAPEMIGKHEESMKALHTYILANPIDSANVTDKDALKTFEGKLDMAELIELAGLTVRYYNTVNETVKFPHVKYNTVSDRISSYQKLYSINSNTKYESENGTSFKYTDVMARVNAIALDIVEKNKEMRDAADYNAPLDEYKLVGNTFTQDFQASEKAPWTFTHATDISGTKLTVESDASGNKYADFHVTTISKAYIDQGVAGTTDGYVMEFDLSTDDPNGITSIGFYAPTYKKGDGARLIQPLFKIVNNNVCDNSRNPLAEDVFTAGEWTHIVLIWKPDMWVEILVDYVSVGSYLAGPTNDSYNLTHLRIQADGTNTDYHIDNMNFYKGTSYRNPGKFASMTANEKFMFYVDYFYDTNKDPLVRNVAYMEAKRCFSAIDENAEGMKAYIDRYDAFNYERDILEPARKLNIQRFEDRVDELDGGANRIQITSENYKFKRETVLTIDEFIAGCGNYINQSDLKYVELKERVDFVRSECERVANLEKFVEYVGRFHKATTYASMTRYMNSAAEYYKICRFDIEANYEYCKGDPIVVKLEETIGMNMVTYYNGFAALVGERAKYENSERIIDCVFIIETMEGYEATEEFWAANEDYIAKYATIIRDIVSAENYDASYKGVNEAIEKFKVLDVFFYANLQAEHKELIKAQLDRYKTTDSYIEKLGICGYISDYIANNDIDEENAELKALLFLHSVYTEEIAVHKDQYSDILEQNTVYFISTVNKMAAYVTYSEIKPLYDEALVYYYAMNIDSAEAKEAINTFAQYEAMLNSTETASAIFKGYVKELNTTLGATANAYKALVKCDSILEDVDATVNGVSEAIADYNAKLVEYNNAISVVNNQISDVNSVVCSVREISIPGGALAIIKSIFTK